MKAPVTICLIVKNEPLLENCLKSIRDYVEEIVVVDTGSTDNITHEIAKKYADKFEIFTDCNDENGLIEDFSKARQRSFDLATQSYCLWIDADDLIEGIENLPNIIFDLEKDRQDFNGLSVLFKYEYSYDENGNCTCSHYRERLIYNKNSFIWANPVHEVLIANAPNIKMITREDMVWKHQRQYSKKIQEPGRNLRILRKYVDKVGDSDARQLYYLGLELFNTGLLDEAIQNLTKYIDISGWEDERVMACLKLIDIYQLLAQYQSGLKWGFKAIEIKENWAEGYFALAKMFYFLANQGGPDEFRNWEKCVYFSQLGLKLPETKTWLFINPLEREYEVHKYLNMALSKIGRVQEALNSVLDGMRKKPNDQHFVHNKKIYETLLARQQIMSAVSILNNNETIDKLAVDNISNIINCAPINIEVKQNAQTVSTQIENIIIDNNFPVVKSNSDSRYWNIPSSYDFSDFPMKMSQEQLQATIIMIWKQFMLHDEVLSAISFLENSPYLVRHTFETEKALKLTKDCLVWMDNKDEFQKVNAPANPNVEAGNPMPNKLVMTEGHRFDLIVNHLAPNSKIVDFGSSTGGYPNRYGLLGHKVTGIDVCQTSINVARSKAIEFNTGAEFICSYFQDVDDKLPHNSFDFAVSSDTYEHLRDPINDMLIPAKKLLKEDGKFLMATPHGAWMRGQYVEWAHPWLWKREGKDWLTPSPRAHLIAPTVWSVVKHFKEAGYWVKDCYADLCDNSLDYLSREIIDQGNVFAEAHVQAPKNYPGLDIVFYIGDGLEDWTPQTIKKTGTGGSELMCQELSKRLSIQGNRVRVYNSCGKNGEGIYDGVEYFHTNKYQDLTCDVLIVSRYAQALSDKYNIKSKLSLLWVHDVLPQGVTSKLLIKADRILALSQWHKQNILNHYSIPEEQIIVTRNGIDLNRFNKEIKKDRFKCINSSSPDRSWAILLSYWKEIKSRVPQATLHLYYGFYNWEKVAPSMPGHIDLINRLKQQIKELESFGVVYHDRVNQQELADAMMSAGVLLYPTWFSETYFISGNEAQAAGMRVITSPIAAINETVGDRAFALIPGEWTSEEYKNKFIDAAILALTKEDESDRDISKKYAKEHFCLDKLAEDWQKMFYGLIEEVKVNPILPYKSTI